MKSRFIKLKKKDRNELVVKLKSRMRRGAVPGSRVTQMARDVLKELQLRSVKDQNL